MTTNGMSHPPAHGEHFDKGRCGAFDRDTNGRYRYGEDGSPLPSKPDSSRDMLVRVEMELDAYTYERCGRAMAGFFAEESRGNLYEPRMPKVLR